MNRRALIPLIAGLAVGGLALKLGLNFVQRAKGANDARASVWVAQQDIPRWVAIDETMLKAIEFPSQVIPPGAFTEKKELLGRVLRMTAPTNLPILDSMLLPPGEKPGLQVPQGLRAVGVKIDEGSGVDYHLQPGCRVDVIGYFSVRKGGQTQLISKTVVQDVEVGAVGAHLTAVSPTDPEDSGKTKGRQEKVRAVTLFVTPEDAPLLHMAEQKGKIKLAMRGSGGGVERDAPQVTDKQLYGDDGAGEDTEGEQPGLLSGFFSMFSSPQSQPQVASQLPPEGPPAEPVLPAVTWRMRIWNGDQLLTLGWPRMDSIEAIDLTAAELARGKPRAPSTLEQAAALRARTTPKTGGTTGPAGTAATGDVEEPEEPEPEELEE